MRNRGCSHDAQTAASEANCLLEGGRGAIKLCEGKERRDARQILASQQIDAVLRGLRQRECLSPYGKKSHRRGTVDRLDYFRKQRSCKDAFGCQRFCGCDIRWTVVADRNPGCLCFYKKKGRKKAERNPKYPHPNFSACRSSHRQNLPPHPLGNRLFPSIADAVRAHYNKDAREQDRVVSELRQ